MTKNIKEQYISLLDNQRKLLDNIVYALSPHAGKTQDPHEQQTLSLLRSAAGLVGDASDSAKRIQETDS